MKNCKAMISTAIPIERESVCSHLREIKRDSCNGTQYWRGSFLSVNSTWDILVVETGKGNTAAALETERALSYFKPTIALFCGIAGGIKDVRIGDVVAANDVLYYEFQKVSELDGETKTQARPSAFLSNYDLIQLAKFESSRADWQKHLDKTNDHLKPKVLCETIVSGEGLIASRDAELYRYLRSNYNQAVAVEMEGYGFLSATHAQNTPALIIRGISDLIENKSKSDSLGSQQVAANAASAFAFEILAKYTCKTKPRLKKRPLSKEQLLDVPAFPAPDDNRYWDKPLSEALAKALSGHFNFKERDLDQFYEDCRYSECQYILGMDGSIYLSRDDSPEAEIGRPFRIKPDLNAKVIAEMLDNPTPYMKVILKAVKEIEDRRNSMEKLR